MAAEITYSGAIGCGAGYTGCMAYRVAIAKTANWSVGWAAVQAAYTAATGNVGTIYESGYSGAGIGQYAGRTILQAKIGVVQQAPPPAREQAPPPKKKITIPEGSDRVQTEQREASPYDGSNDREFQSNQPTPENPPVKPPAEIPPPPREIPPPPSREGGLNPVPGGQGGPGGGGGGGRAPGGPWAPGSAWDQRLSGIDWRGRGAEFVNWLRNNAPEGWEQWLCDKEFVPHAVKIAAGCLVSENGGPEGGMPAGNAGVVIGAGVQPRIVTRVVRQCPRDANGERMILGKDGLCYRKKDLSDKQKMHHRPKAKVTAAAWDRLVKAKSTAKTVKSFEQKLADISKETAPRVRTKTKRVLACCNKEPHLCRCDRT